MQGIISIIDHMENWYDNSKTQITVLHLHETSMMWIEYCSSSEPKSVLVSSDLFKYLDVLGTFFFFFFEPVCDVNLCRAAFFMTSFEFWMRWWLWAKLVPGWKQASGVAPEAWANDGSSELKLETFGAASVHHQSHTVVDRQSYDTMEPQRTSLYISYPYFFSHALNDRRSGHSLQNLQKQGLSLSTAALSMSSGFITKEAVVCLHCTPHPFV